MTSGVIAVVVGAVISILLEVIPGLKDIWTNWAWKRLTLLVLSLGVPAIVWVLACYAQFAFPFDVGCTPQGLITFLYLGFLAFLGEQTTYLVGTSGLPSVLERNA